MQHTQGQWGSKESDRICLHFIWQSHFFFCSSCFMVYHSVLRIKVKLILLWEVCVNFKKVYRNSGNTLESSENIITKPFCDLSNQATNSYKWIAYYSCTYFLQVSSQVLSHWLLKSLFEFYHLEETADLRLSPQSDEQNWYLGLGRLCKI